MVDNSPEAEKIFREREQAEQEKKRLEEEERKRLDEDR